MKKKKMIGFVLMAIGIVLFIVGLYERGRVARAQSNVSETSGMFGGGAVNQGITGAVENKIGSNYTPIMWIMIGGVALFAIGAGTVYFSRRR